MDAGAVAGLAVGVDRAAVPDRAQRVDAGLHHLAARLAVDRGDETDAAGVMLEARVVQAVRGASLVVWGVRDGRDAANAMHAYLEASAPALALAS